MPRLGRLTAISLAAMASAAVAAGCGSSSSSTTSAASSASTSTAAASATTSASNAASSNASCIPPVPSALPNDPDGVAAALTGDAKAAMGGYPGAVYKSPWANFKPKHGPPWVIGISDNQSVIFEQDLGEGIEQWAHANPNLVSKVITLVDPTSNDIPTQIQQMQSLLAQHVDIMFSSLSSPSAENGVINQAAKDDVPVISIEAKATTPSAVNLAPNFTQLGYYGAAGLVNAMGGKPGNVLIVQAVAGQSFNTQVNDAGLSVLNACKMTLVGNGSIFGQYDAATAKTAVLQYLSGHPGTINGVFQVSAMAPGIIGAFQQLGRPVPPIADLNPGAPSLVYWKEHASTYNGSAVAIVPLRQGQYAGAIAQAMLQGRGLKITDVPFVAPVITSANLDQWVEPTWTTSTAAQANGPANAIPITALVNGYMSKP